MARTPRSSLKKHDVAADSRASKARRDRTTTQIRKDKRRDTVQAKRKRLMSGDAMELTGRGIEELVLILKGDGHQGSHQDQYQVLQEIRMLLSTSESDYEALEKIIESGIVPVLVELLNSASPLSSATRSGGEVFKEILWCLTNIASGQYDHTKLVLPAVPRLLQFLEGSNATLAEHAAWVLGNIAADCDEFRHQLIKNGAIVPLTKQLASTGTDPETKQLMKTCAWALSNLARGHESSAKPFVDAGIIPVVIHGLQQGPRRFDDAMVVEVAWLLSFLTAREEEFLKLWLENGLIEVLLPYFATSEELLLTPILRVFGNICCGTFDHHTDEWQLPFIHKLLQGESIFLQKLVAFLQMDVAASHAHLASESAWVLSNLATLDGKVVDVIISAGFLPLLAQQFHTGSYEVRREVAFALTNIALTSGAHLNQVLALDVLPGYLQLLSAADVAIVGNSLRMVENILRLAPNGVGLIESHDGIEAIENVQYQSQETHLSKWAEAIVNEFYGENYGINSPPSVPVTGGAMPDFGSFMLPPPQADHAGGRGRGAHMTTPAWKK